jgi:peptidyl-dipeptidase A
MLLRIAVIAAVFLPLAVVSVPALQPVQDADAAAHQVIKEHEAIVRPLERASALAWWNANVSGKDEDFKAKEDAQNKLDAALSDKDRFGRIKGLKDGGKIKDSHVARQIDLLYLMYLEKQIDAELLKQMSAKSNAVEKAFNVYRAVVDGKEMADSEVRKVLRESKDSERRQLVWAASKGSGAKVEKDLIELVKLRNQAAKRLGFKNFHEMTLRLNEQDPQQVLALFDELDELTREPFRKLMDNINTTLAKHYGIKPADLRPWHYQDPFFQESAKDYTVVPGDKTPPADLDAVYAKVDIMKVCRDYYAGIGLPIDDVLARSDLYEKKGKSPHAFCTDIDREGDVRVLANVVPNEYWMNTMLHELGHAVYSSKFIPQKVPYLLRQDAHILATEGIAMMMERCCKSSTWCKQMGIAVPDPAAYDRTGSRMLQAQLLIFSRWCQVMLRFEIGLYDNPDQDLNKLWWDLVERYQLVKRPDKRSAPDYASKIHICSAPCYYHNYMMGELFASQVHHTIARDVLKTEPAKALYTGRKEVGDFLKQKVFAPGRSVHWNDLTKFATGAPLNAKAFAQDFRGQ